jgi:hypothetical protein
MLLGKSQDKLRLNHKAWYRNLEDVAPEAIAQWHLC